MLLALGAGYLSSNLSFPIPKPFGFGFSPAKRLGTHLFGDPNKVVIQKAAGVLRNCGGKMHGD
jgi:hypothetical protein